MIKKLREYKAGKLWESTIEQEIKIRIHKQQLHRDISLKYKGEDDHMNIGEEKVAQQKISLILVFLTTITKKVMKQMHAKLSQILVFFGQLVSLISMQLSDVQFNILH